jgi:hypothetical protein
MSQPGHTPFAARAIRPLGVIGRVGYRLKRYSVAYGPEPLRPQTFDPGVELALRELPQPAVAGGRPGLGFVICHQGRGGDYVVLCWWDLENELPTRVFVRGEQSWRPARDGESFCVWDLEILWLERQAYVATLLGGGIAAPAEEYLGRTYQCEAAP